MCFFSYRSNLVQSTILCPSIHWKCVSFLVFYYVYRKLKTMNLWFHVCAAHRWNHIDWFALSFIFLFSFLSKYVVVCLWMCVLPCVHIEIIPPMLILLHRQPGIFGQEIKKPEWFSFNEPFSCSTSFVSQRHFSHMICTHRWKTACLYHKSSINYASSGIRQWAASI